VTDADADLVARARSGEAGAFAALVRRHQGAVYRAALAAVGSHADAEEAAQDAFVLAWKRLDTFRGEAAFRTWLLAIAWKQALNRRRSLVRWWRRAVELEEVTVGSRPIAAALCAAGTFRPADPEAIASSLELRRHIRSAVLALPRKLRDALLLSQSGEYCYEEIAAMLGAPVGTVKWRVAAARRKVRQRLEALGHELG
jgi:RNA polymerase sigma-70 factor (ECF subfamily)